LASGFPELVRRTGEVLQFSIHPVQSQRNKASPSDDHLRNDTGIRSLNGERGSNGVRHWLSLDRFQREAHILASFQHPNMVTLFDVGVMADGRPFLVMERLQGRTLSDDLDCRGCARALRLTG
jgi:serine/threonine protein kinase